MSSYPSYETVLFEKADGIGWATLNRPDKRNAMSPQLHLEMSDLLSRIEVDPEVRVLVLAGAGEAWCAGMDLKLFFRDLENKPAERARVEEASHRWRWQRLFTFPVNADGVINGDDSSSAWKRPALSASSGSLITPAAPCRSIA